MKSQEKAQQLVDKFKPHSYNGAIEESDKLMELYHAKQSALIAVDEVLNALANTDTRQFEFGFHYWKQVKQEIEQL